MKLDKENMAKTSFKLAASESCGDVCAAKCLINGQTILVVTLYVSPNTPIDDWKSLIFFKLGWVFSKSVKIFKFLARWGCEDMPVILTGDFNVNMKDNYNAELVEFMKDTFKIDVLSDLSQGTTRSNTCIDMLLGRNVDNLSCMSYHRPILNTTNHQATQLTDVTTN
jgi:hypothetical protein